MTDRELLELAAKAAGIGLFVWGAKGAENFTIKHPDGTPGDRWKPLTDDGDALRLAVKLKIDIDFDLDNPLVEAYRKLADDEARVFCEVIRADGSGVRRAIVSAAAEIGKALA